MGTGWYKIGSQIQQHKYVIAILLALVWAVEYMVLGNEGNFWQIALCTSLIVILAVLDTCYMRLYHRLTLSLGIVAAASGLLLGTNSLPEILAGAGIFGGLMLGLFLVTGGLGFGDVCYGAALGAFLGTEQALLGFFMTFFLGMLWAGGIYVQAKLFSRSIKGIVPLGPFMAAGSLISVIYGKELIGWYLQGF